MWAGVFHTPFISCWHILGVLFLLLRCYLYSNFHRYPVPHLIPSHQQFFISLHYTFAALLSRLTFSLTSSCLHHHSSVCLQWSINLSRLHPFFCLCLLVSISSLSPFSLHIILSSVLALYYAHVQKSFSSSVPFCFCSCPLLCFPLTT